MSSAKEWGIVLFFSVTLAIIFKSFFFDVFIVPTSSMVSTLVPGDVIMVNKLKYGPKFTTTPLSIPFLNKHVPFTGGMKAYTDIIRLPYMRMPGYGEVKRNDLLVFYYPLDDLFPVDHRTFFVKRCIGLPGEKIESKNDLIYIDDELIPDNAKLSFPYVVKTKSDIDELLKESSVYEGGRIHNEFTWELILDSTSRLDISKDPRIESIEPSKIPIERWNDHMFPSALNMRWNLARFGPIYIPKKGDSIRLNESNIPLYSSIIEKYEGHQLQVSPDGEIVIDKIPTSFYKIEMDYFFVMGDNRHNSSDSRYWGFLPEDHIIGKASRIVYSKDSNGILWDRFLKSID